MEKVSPQPKPRIRGRLARRLLLLLIPLTLLPVLAMGTANFLRSSQLIQSQIDTQLETIVQNQSNQIERRTQADQKFLEDLQDLPAFQVMLDNAIEIGQQGSLFTSVRDRMMDAYEKASFSLTGGEPPFNHFIIALPDGRVIVSSNTAWDGIILDGNPGYQALLASETTLTLYKTEPFYQDHALTFTSYPYTNSNKRTAILIGVSESTSTLGILENSAIFHPQARAYLYTHDGYFTGIDTDQRALVLLQPSEAHQNAILGNLQSHDGQTLTFTSFGGEQVLGVTKALPSLQSALMVEVPQDVIFGPIRTLIPFAVIAFLVIFLLAGVVVWLSASRLVVGPIVSLSETTRLFAEGDWQQRSSLKRNDEIGDLAWSFNDMADELTGLYRSLESLVEERSAQVRAAAEVAELVTSATSLNDLLNRTVELIVDRFSYYDASIFLVDEARENAALSSAAGASGGVEAKGDYRLPVGSRSLVGWVTANNRVRIANDITQDPYFARDEILPDTRSEAVVPLSFGEYVVGALDVQSDRLDAFDQDAVTLLQTIANQVAIAIHNMRLLENTTINLEEASLLYQASRRIAQAETSDGILRVVAEALSDTSYTSAILVGEDNGMNIFASSNPYPVMRAIDAPPPPTWLSLQPEELNQRIPSRGYLIVDDLSQADWLSAALGPLLEEWQCQSLALLSIVRSSRAPIILAMGAVKQDALSPAVIQPFASLAELSATAIEKVQALQDTQKRLIELQALSATSQIVAGGTSLSDLYRALHRQVTEVMGEVRFLVALYNAETTQIEVPYMYDQTSIKTLAPFPLGEGLTSILIRSQQPLMIVEDTERRTKELGAITVGQMAKSWLGVPLIVGGEAIGAIIVQDTDHEHRFNENDQRILMTLAGQVAATIHNVRLLEHTRLQAERDRRLHEVVTKIRSSTDMHTILFSTASEIGKVLGANRVHVEVGVRAPTVEQEDGNGHLNGDTPAGDPSGGEE